MNAALTRLEKSKIFWFLLGLNVLFFLFRLPAIIEPHWYGDEGIYQIIGMAMHQGHMLYATVWDNKPPFLYVTYALFAGDQQSVRLFAIFVGILTNIAFFFLARQLLQRFLPAAIATGFFAFLFATPFLEGNIANAENFMLLPIIVAAYLVYAKRNYFLHTKIPTLFVAGLLLGTAFLFKTVAIFDLGAFSLFLILIKIHEVFSVKKIFLTLRYLLPLFLGFLIPLCMTIVYFAWYTTLDAFFAAAFAGNIAYVGYENVWIIPQGLLILKTLLLLFFLFLIIRHRRSLSPKLLFIFIWLTFSLYSACFSQRPYTHYLLIALPALSLLIGYIVLAPMKKSTAGLLFLVLAIGMFIGQSFYFYGWGKTINYYQNALTFLIGQKSVTDYRTFFDPQTPRDYEIAAFIKKQLPIDATVYIWGDSPQIYALANKIPPQRYTSSYHVAGNTQRIEETRQTLLLNKPDYLIILDEAPPLSFHLPSYQVKYILKGATIYERSF